MKRLAWLVCLGLLAAPALTEHHEKPGMEDMSPEDQAMMEAYMKAGMPSDAHKMLAESVGNWKATVKSFMGPGEPMVSEGTSTREMILDGRVLKDVFKGDFMGTPFVGQGMSGYDNVTGKYWSTWNDSMSTGIMVSEGNWDDEMKGVVWKGSFNDPMIGGPKTVKMVTSRPGPGQELLEIWEEHDGEMVKTMEMSLVKE